MGLGTTKTDVELVQRHDGPRASTPPPLPDERDRPGEIEPPGTSFQTISVDTCGGIIFGGLGVGFVIWLVYLRLVPQSTSMVPVAVSWAIGIVVCGIGWGVFQHQKDGAARDAVRPFHDR